MKILFVIYLITVVLGALGEFFISTQLKNTIKNSNYVKVENSSHLLGVASILKLCIMTLIPLYNIILFIVGFNYTEEKCIKSIEETKMYVKKE